MRLYLFISALLFLGCNSPTKKPIQKKNTTSQIESIAIDTLKPTPKTWSLYKIGGHHLGQITDSCTWYSEGCWSPDCLFLRSDSIFIYHFSDSYDYNIGYYGEYEITNDSLILNFSSLKRYYVWEEVPNANASKTYVQDSIVNPKQLKFKIDTSSNCKQIITGDTIGIKVSNIKKEFDYLNSVNLYLDFIPKTTIDSVLSNHHLFEVYKDYFPDFMSKYTWLYSNSIHAKIDSLLDKEVYHPHFGSEIEYSNDSLIKVYEYSYTQKNSIFTSFIYYKNQFLGQYDNVTGDILQISKLPDSKYLFLERNEHPGPVYEICYSSNILDPAMKFKNGFLFSEKNHLRICGIDYNFRTSMTFDTTLQQLSYSYLESGTGWKPTFAISEDLKYQNGSFILLKSDTIDKREK